MQQFEAPPTAAAAAAPGAPDPATQLTGATLRLGAAAASSSSAVGPPGKQVGVGGGFKMVRILQCKGAGHNSAMPMSHFLPSPPNPSLSFQT